MTGADAIRPDPYASNEDWAAAGIPLPGLGSDYRVVEVEVLDDHRLLVRHRDGVSGVVCFEPSRFAGAFAALSDPALFRQAHVEHGAVVWNDDVDLAPDNMHRHLFAFGEWVLW